MTREPIEVPFSENGALMHYAHPNACRGRFDAAHEWRVPDEIRLQLTIQHTERGRSAAYFIWLDELGRYWPMFMTDVLGLLQRTIVTQGTVEGMWMPCKRGQNFGLRYAGPVREES